MNIGEAIEAIKRGERATRQGWNGKDMWIAYSPGMPDGIHWSSFWSLANRLYADKQPNGCVPVLPCITMKTASGEILMGWLASQTDLLADDWLIVL